MGGGSKGRKVLNDILRFVHPPDSARRLDSQARNLIFTALTDELFPRCMINKDLFGRDFKTQIPNRFSDTV
jgi:hypothetical protein